VTAVIYQGIAFPSALIERRHQAFERMAKGVAVCHHAVKES